MSAGRGLIHGELPEQEKGRMEGFQPWLNPPAADKLGTPGYRDIPTGEIPELRRAGASHGVAGAAQTAHTDPLHLGLHLQPGAVFEQVLPAGHNAFVYVYRGDQEIDGGAARTSVPRERLAVHAARAMSLAGRE
jgi:redox-sensitive bicupin YhaK (pirin superfamily)